MKEHNKAKTLRGFQSSVDPTLSRSPTGSRKRQLTCHSLGPGDPQRSQCPSPDAMLDFVSLSEELVLGGLAAAPAVHTQVLYTL